MKELKPFRKWGWAYDLDPEAPTALIYGDCQILEFPPLTPPQKKQLTTLVSLLNRKRVVAKGSL